MGKKVEANQADNAPGLNIDGVSGSCFDFPKRIKDPCPKCGSEMQKVGRKMQMCKKCGSGWRDL